MLEEIVVKEQKVRIITINNQEYISLTDLARYADSDEPRLPINNWMRNKDVILYLGLWEKLSNPSFKRVEFASWLSPEFKLYLIQEFQRLKKNEAYQNKIDWHASRVLAKVNYIIHTDAIKSIIVPNLTERQKKFVYSEEADVLNVALFGMTSKEWRDKNPNLKGNIRDYTDLLHLVILNNLENINASLIEMKIPQNERLIRLNNIAQRQIELIKNNKSLEHLEIMEDKINKKLELNKINNNG